jgi:hypothetical protein
LLHGIVGAASESILSKVAMQEAYDSSTFDCHTNMKLRAGLLALFLVVGGLLCCTRALLNL